MAMAMAMAKKQKNEFWRELEGTRAAVVVLDGLCMPHGHVI
jgi:hypothetical protein